MSKDCRGYAVNAAALPPKNRSPRVRQGAALLESSVASNKILACLALLFRCLEFFLRFVSPRGVRPVFFSRAILHGGWCRPLSRDPLSLPVGVRGQPYPCIELWSNSGIFHGTCAVCVRLVRLSCGLIVHTIGLFCAATTRCFVVMCVRARCGALLLSLACCCVSFITSRVAAAFAVSRPSIYKNVNVWFPVPQ